MDPLFDPLPEDVDALSADELSSVIEGRLARIREVTAAPAEYVTADRTADQVYEETAEAVASLESLRATLAAKNDESDPEPEPEPESEDDAAAAAAAEALATRMAALATQAETAPEPEPTPVVAAAEPPAPPARRPLPPASRTHAPAPAPEFEPVPLVASAGADGVPMGQEFRSEIEVAEAMQRRRRQFGFVPEGVRENVGIAIADWSDRYPEERRLGQDEARNFELVAAATKPADILREFEARRRRQLNGDSLVASGGLCAPVTPYYQLQMISVADRPVRGALPGFNADRGGIRYARPAALSSITTGVGTKTAANDFAGGTEATKTCQTISCPNFQETDVEIIYHCIKFGNLGARTFPERVAQSNNLVLAAHARLAETVLLTGIDGFSTAVTAGNLGLGASASLFSQILTAASGVRSRNRMDTQAVLRIFLPFWAPALIVSDVIRSQFQRFETDEAKVTALLRSFNIEPTYYIDGATGANQVYGSQNAGALLAFPSTVVWYLYPEGSFLYLDGGTLELGLVRDSVLNATNDFQIFGESFENVAFVGVESLKVTSTICDSGAVALPLATSSCGSY